MKTTLQLKWISVWSLVATIVVLFLFATVPTAAHAQGLGRISGIVTDATGAAIPGAKVTATQAGTGYSSVVTTNGVGEYVFPSLAPTTYNIIATAPGFTTEAQNGLKLEADQALTVNAKLGIGTASQSVTVTTATPQVDTTTGTMSQVIGQQQVN